MIDEKRFSKQATKDLRQNIILENRKKLSVSGVVDVESFDEECVNLYTEAGLLHIKGEGLKISKLSVESGDVSIDGEITSLVYTDDDPKEKGLSVFKKLFK